MMQRIKFQGTQYILVGGAITTEERYKSGTVSFAHLGDDGIIRRYHEEIGTKADLEFLGEIEDVSPTPEGIANMLSGRSWF